MLGNAGAGPAGWCRPAASHASMREKETLGAETQRGDGFCGVVAIAATGAPVELGYCPCAPCRSCSGGPLTAFTLRRRPR